MRKFLTVLFLIIITYSLIINTSYAHGVVKTLTSQQDPYQLMVTYDETDLTIWGYTTFGFYLKDQDSNNVQLESIWFRIAKDNNIIFAGPISAKGQLPIATVSFPKEGTYKIYARFQKDGKTQKEANFELTVPKIEEQKDIMQYIKTAVVFFAGVLLGSASILALGLLKKKKK